MAERVTTSDSYETLRRFCARAQASMLAHDELKPQAAAWESAADDTLAVHVAAMKGEDELEAAAVAERLALFEWSRALDSLAETSASAEPTPDSPHAALAAAISSAQSLCPGLGAATTVKVGRELVTLAGAVEGDFGKELDAPATVLERATVRVERAHDTRNTDPDHIFGFKIAKAELVRRINELADESSVFILRKLPGRSDLVEEIFSAA